MAAYLASLVASLCFAWRGEPRRFGIAYMLGWGLVAAALVFVLGADEGVHGSPFYMLAWGLIYLLPFFALVSAVTGLAAALTFWLGSRYREG